MSKESYINGFCKAAAANGVDPAALAQIATMNKKASNSIWEGVLKVIDNVKNKWDNLNPEYKPLVGGLAGAGGGALGGALVGKLFGVGAGKGALAGAGIGGLGGALYGSHVGMKQRIKGLNSEHQKAINELTAKRDADAAASAKLLADTKGEYEGKIEGLKSEHQKALKELAAKGDADAAAAARLLADTKGEYEGKISNLEKLVKDKGNEAEALRGLRGLKRLEKMTPAQFEKYMASLSPERRESILKEIQKQQDLMKRYEYAINDRIKWDKTNPALKNIAVAGGGAESYPGLSEEDLKTLATLPREAQISALLRLKREGKLK